MSKFANYEPLTEEESKELFFKVQALESLVSDVIDAIEEHLPKNEKLSKALADAYHQYTKSI